VDIWEEFYRETGIRIVNLGPQESVSNPKRWSRKPRGYRTAVCHSCGDLLDSRLDETCVRCGWIKCGCGACGCTIRR